jgi:transcriptional regulator with XRE-family HTH domain
MTPFGKKIREMRAERGIALKNMAHTIGVSPAYLSALEHGHRGQPTFYLVQRIIGFFNIIWDEAEELERLARLSHPRAQIDTAGLPEQATELANLLAQHVRKLETEDLDALIALLRDRLRGRISD